MTGPIATNAYAGKRALFDRLGQVFADENGPLGRVQVAYSYPGANAEHKCVYGGGVVFEQPEEEAGQDGDSWLTKENAIVSVHIRVEIVPFPEGGIEDTDVEAEAIGDAIAAELAANRHLAGGHSVSRILGGQGDYDPYDDRAVSILTLRIGLQSYLT